MTWLERGYPIGDTAALTGGTGYGGYGLLVDDPPK
jgi:hypothetical protein